MKNYIWKSTSNLWFSMKLEEYLRFNNIKQHVFAKMLGVSQPHINLVLQGKRNPSVSLAKKIENITEGRVSAFEILGINMPEKILKITETYVDPRKSINRKNVQ